jgi:putative PIN family toxin of toxin-antitoxin system
MSLRAVQDTNVLVSGLLAEVGAPRVVLDAWLDDQFVLVTSLYLLDELTHVLSYPRIAQRIRLGNSEMEALLAALLARAHVVAGQLHLPGTTRDPKDDAVVACAIEGEASYIVSGDEDLLVLGTYAGVEIVSPARFVRILRRDSAGATGRREEGH